MYNPGGCFFLRFWYFSIKGFILRFKSNKAQPVMIRLFFWILFSFLFVGLSAQTDDDDEYRNIVPNPGFELYSGPPIGWFYKGDHYTQVMKYWSAPTIASPDVFGPRVRVPQLWADKGFGEKAARSGHSMTGITVYGCDEGKPHCREYIQIQLAEPLVVGQNYQAEVWVSHLPKSLHANNLGFYFADTKISEITDGPLNFEPQVYAKEVLDASTSAWVKVAGKFKAETEADYVIIGNFFPDSLTTVNAPCTDHLKFAYYYLDDVLIKKLPPILPIPVAPDDLTKVVLEEGKTVRLKNIFFEFDKAELLPRSFVELRKLLKIMRENPMLNIEIQGHTDSKGDDTYNLSLSEKRAAAVVDFLNRNGIEKERTAYKGFGSQQPIADNANADGRQQNRRVEFLILGL